MLLERVKEKCFELDRGFSQASNACPVSLTLASTNSPFPLISPISNTLSIRHNQTLPSKSVGHLQTLYIRTLQTHRFTLSSFLHSRFFFFCSTMGATALINGVHGLSISPDMQFGDSTTQYASSNGCSNTPSSVRSDSPSQMSSSTVGNNPPEPQPVFLPHTKSKF